MKNQIIQHPNTEGDDFWDSFMFSAACQLFWHAAENSHAAQLSYCTTCDLHAAQSYNKNLTLTKSLCITVMQTWNNGVFGTGLERQPNQKCNLAIRCWLCKLASSAAICTCKVTSEWCSSHLAGKGRILFNCFQIANTEDGNILYVSHQHPEVNWIFFLRCFTFGHRIFVTEKGFSGKYCSLFSHTHTKNSFCCDSCSISQKNQLFPRICHHFSLPSKQLTAVKPNRIRTHSPLKPTTTPSAGQSPLQAFLYNQGLKCNSAVRPRLFYDGSPGWNAGAQISHLRLT